MAARHPSGACSRGPASTRETLARRGGVVPWPESGPHPGHNFVRAIRGEREGKKPRGPTTVRGKKIQKKGRRASSIYRTRRRRRRRVRRHGAPPRRKPVANDTRHKFRMRRVCRHARGHVPRHARVVSRRVSHYIWVITHQVLHISYYILVMACARGFSTY